MKADDIKQRFVLDSQGTADLKYRLKQDPQGGLKEAARQFESLMLTMVMKSMRDATPQDGLLSSDQTRFFNSLPALPRFWAKTITAKQIALLFQAQSSNIIFLGMKLLS